MVGIDLVEIKRMSELTRLSNFLSKVFTEGEILYYRKKGEKPETLAGMYAAKEAVAKALGTGISGFRLNDIEITHEDNGAPKIILHKEAKKIAAGKNITISISHDGGIAAAVAMIV